MAARHRDLYDVYSVHSDVHDGSGIAAFRGVEAERRYHVEDIRLQAPGPSSGVPIRKEKFDSGYPNWLPRTQIPGLTRIKCVKKFPAL